MNMLLELIINQGLLVDILGVLGLGLVALAAIRIAQRWNSSSGSIMTWGAISLLVGRSCNILFAQFVTPFNQASFDPMLIAIGKNVPIALLTIGLGAIVWGFWGHERHLSGETITD